MLGNKDVRAAIIVMPPEDQWSQIQTVRKAHDKAFDRWMPHINMIFPFLREAEQKKKGISTRLQEALANFSPFTVELREFDFFEHSPKSCTLFANPAGASSKIIALQKLIWGVIPECDDQNKKSKDGFHPHLTLGQFSKRDVTVKIQQLESNWKPIIWTVDHIEIIRRDVTGPFSVVERIPLGSKPSIPKQLTSEPVTIVAAIPPSKSEPKQKHVYSFDVSEESDEPESTTPVVPTKTLQDLELELNNSNHTSSNWQTKAIAEIVKRIVSWVKLLRQQNQGLPKTVSKFNKAIASFCYFEAKEHVNAASLFERLQNEQFVRIVEVRTKRVTTTPKLKNIVEQDYYSQVINRQLVLPQNFAYSNSSMSRSSDDDSAFEVTVPDTQTIEKLAYDRLVLWLHSLINGEKPFAAQLDSFQNQLQQMVEFKIFIPADQIFSHLRENLHLVDVEYSFETETVIVH